MPTHIHNTSGTSGSELFIIDNSYTDWKVLRYLKDWCKISKGIDIAASYFEIGALLALEDEWQKVEKIRILLGDEVSQRTRLVFEQGLNLQKGLQSLKDHLRENLESEKDRDDFLTGVPAIVEAIKQGKIECRVYCAGKFHAKAYITHARLEVVGSAGLVGSSNFTRPGLTENIELNVKITGSPVSVLQNWYEEHWNQAEDIKPAILKVVVPHITEYQPFYIYAKALQEFFRDSESTVSEWERHESKLYSKILARYQQEGYHALIEKAKRYKGAFLCDGVGLGKTLIGLMLIERFMHERKNIALFVPKSTRNAVWEAKLKQYLQGVFKGYSLLKIFNHTDLMGKTYKEDLEIVAEQADVIIIDEAHHFRNPGTRLRRGTQEVGSRYWHMYKVIGRKQVFLLTATPINNKMTDFKHMIELFSRRDSDYFRDLGIQSLSQHINNLEDSLYSGRAEEIDASTHHLEERRKLSQDTLFQELVVQRSRKYVKKSIRIGESDHNVKFPETKKPKVVKYSIRQTYGPLLDMVTQAFDKESPLFSFSIYNPYKHSYKYSLFDDFKSRSGRQLVGLIRTLFLKRFESSVVAFDGSCRELFKKFLTWIRMHAETEQEKSLVQEWKERNIVLIKDVYKDVYGYSLDEVGEQDDQEEEEEEDVIPVELLDLEKKVEKLDRKKFDVTAIIDETIQDLDQLVEFLKELRKFEPEQDEKLAALIKLLKSDPSLSKHKVIIFTEFKDTARYLKDELERCKIGRVAEVDSGYKGDRGRIIKRFSPYYNESSSGALEKDGEKEIRILIATDVLSEGLNLQDATRLINYDIHWNPVRLMQRIGRVDRRLDPEVEKRIVQDHPEQQEIRDTIVYWNFLPPDELDVLLRLYEKVSHKILRISKTLGIEGGKLVTEDDDLEDTKNFIENYEGELMPIEKLRLEYQGFLKNDPGLEAQLDALPLRAFSGKAHISTGVNALFFCYTCSVKDSKGDRGLEEVEKRRTFWCLYDVRSGQIMEDPLEIVKYIRCTKETSRKISMDRVELSEIRKRVEKHIKDTHLKKVQATMDIKPVLRCWMELV